MTTTPKEKTKKAPKEKTKKAPSEPKEATKKAPNEAFTLWRELVFKHTGKKGVLRKTDPSYEKVKAEYDEERSKRKNATIV